MTLKMKLLENILGKGENVGYQHFLLFSEYFLPFPKQISFFFSQSLLLFDKILG